MTLTFKTNRLATDPAAEVRRRDNLLIGAGGGDLFLGEFGLDYCYDQTNPAPNAKAVVSANESGNNAAMAVSSGSVAYTGHMLDFTGVTAAGGGYLQLPASVSASIWGAGAGLQYFLAMFYAKLPTAAEWVGSTGAADAIGPLLSFATETNGFQGGADLLTIGMTRFSTLVAYRQRSLVALDSLSVQPAEGDYGSICQLAFWRNAAGQGFRIKKLGSGASAVLTTAAVGAVNGQDFSARGPRLGISTAFWYPTLNNSHATAKKFKVTRPYFENLQTSGRDPVTVIDADWNRMLARPSGLYA